MIHLAVFVVATALSVLLGAVVRRSAPAIGAVVPPRPDRWHNTPTPTMGGVGIAIAVVGGFLLVLLQPRLIDASFTWAAVLLAGLAMFVIGVLDDRLQLSPLAKLVSSLAVGAFVVFALAELEPGAARPPLYILAAIVWFAGVCHAVNLLDNMDGLAAGVALVAAAGLVGVTGGALGPTVVVLLLALCGALLGFLHWNRTPARLFMGDSGSLFIGALLASASLVPGFRLGASLVDTSILSALLLVVPLFDTAFVLVLRRLAGRKASKGGTDHVSHRLVSLGFSERSAVRVLYLLGLAGVGTAWALTRFGGVEPLLPLVALFVVVVALLGLFLARVPAYNAEDFMALQKSSFAPFLKDLTFRWHAGQVMLDLVLITACYYFAWWFRFEGEDLELFMPFFTASLPVVLGCKLAALYGSGLYQRSWETFGLRDVMAVFRGVGLGSLLSVLAALYLYRFQGFSRLVFLLDGLLLTLAIVATRASFRSMSLVAAMRNKRSRRVLVYGAGAFGQLLVREMRANAHWAMNPVAFLDDDPMKGRQWIVGVPVRGGLPQLEETMRRYQVDEVVLSSPAINGPVEREIREVCESLDRPVRRLQMEIR